MGLDGHQVLAVDGEVGRDVHGVVGMVFDGAGRHLESVGLHGLGEEGAPPLAVLRREEFLAVGGLKHHLSLHDQLLVSVVAGLGAQQFDVDHVGELHGNGHFGQVAKEDGYTVFGSAELQVHLGGGTVFSILATDGEGVAVLGRVLCLILAGSERDGSGTEGSVGIQDDGRLGVSVGEVGIGQGLACLSIGGEVDVLEKARVGEGGEHDLGQLRAQGVDLQLSDELGQQFDGPHRRVEVEVLLRLSQHFRQLGLEVLAVGRQRGEFLLDVGLILFISLRQASAITAVDDLHIAVGVVHLHAGDVGHAVAITAVGIVAAAGQRHVLAR